MKLYYRIFYYQMFEQLFMGHWAKMWKGYKFFLFYIDKKLLY